MDIRTVNRAIDRLTEIGSTICTVFAGRSYRLVRVEFNEELELIFTRELSPYNAPVQEFAILPEMSDYWPRTQSQIQEICSKPMEKTDYLINL
jgi:hypothetical protein